MNNPSSGGMASEEGKFTTGTKKLMYLVSEDHYFCSHRLDLAIAAKRAGYEVVVVTSVHEDGDVIRNAGLRLIPFEIRRGGLNPFRDIDTIIKLVRLYWKESPALVHHVAMKPVLYGSFAARIARVPRVVNTLAGMGWLFTSTDDRARILKWTVREVLRRLLQHGVTVVQNPDDADLLAQMGIAEKRIRLIQGSGVDLEKFRPVPESGGVPLIVLPARMLWDKGVGEFVAAARLLRNRGMQARFLLAGKPDPVNPASIDPGILSAWAEEGVVEYPGWVADIPQLLARSHIVCLPSYYREGLPKSLIEAAASGRAIITTDAPGCRDVVKDGDNGILIPPRNVEKLVEALEYLLRNPAERMRMGAQGRMLAEREFSNQKVIPETLGIYMSSICQDRRR